MLGCSLGISAGLLGLVLGRMGQLWVAFDLFAQFTLQFGFLALAFALGLLMPRMKVMASTIIFASLVAGYGLWPFLANGGIGVASASSQIRSELKVASFNTWMENSDPEAVIAELQRIDADVVTLVEFGPNKRVLLPKLRGAYPYQADCATADHCNFAILSKFPLNNISSQSEWEGPSYLHAVLGGSFSGLSVVAVHTTRFPHSRAQFKQMKALSRLLQSMPGPKLVMGDFNSTPFSRLATILPMELDMRRLTNMPSWPAHIGLPQLAIDHIYVSSGIVETKAEALGNPSGSDHFPIYMQIKVPPELLGG